MDRNQATGLFLISALLLVYLFFFSPKKDDKNAPQTPAAAAAAAKVAPVAPAAAPGFAAEAPLDSVAGAVQDVTLKNANLTVTLSSRGGRVTAVRLNKYKTFFGKPFDLLDAQSARLDTRFRTVAGQVVKFSGLNFQPSAVETAGRRAARYVHGQRGGRQHQPGVQPARQQL